MQVESNEGGAQGEVERLVARPGVVSVVLVRHGQTAWNRERRFLGRTDVPLDERGRREAMVVGQRLAGLPVDRVVSSPLSRAADTARAIAAPHGLPVQAHPELVELAQGVLEGQLGAELPLRHPAFLAAWLADPGTARIPGGETLVECQARGLRALQEIAAAGRPGRAVVVVSHQMLISAVLCHVLDRSLHHFREVGHKNAAFSVLAFEAGRLVADHVHEHAHLAALGTEGQPAPGPALRA
ncbi:histidine phosphatase family protein [Myxococcota bacterium]|nr:histidine phosphatase family protein [Myxococcota bacterium]